MRRWKNKMVIRAIPTRKLMVVVVTVSLVVTLLNFRHFNVLSNSSRVIETFDEFFDQAGSQTPQGRVDYIARYLDVRWTVKENLQTYAKHIVVLKNRGSETISATDWKICFHHIRILEPVMEEVDDRYTHNVLLGKTGMRVTHISGLLYCMFPDKKLFQPFHPGHELHIPITSSHFQLSRTDCFPNWYVVTPGSSSKTIASTQGESLNFVSSFERPEQWKRSNNDEHNPYTAEDRYYRSKDTVNLKKAGKLIIPTPEELLLLSDEPVILDPSEWVVLESADFSEEVNYLVDELGIKVAKESVQDKFIELTKGDVSFAKHSHDENDEQYQLRVTVKPPKIQITAPSGHGVFNAIQSLLNVAEALPETKSRSIASILVKDRPRFRYRGYMVDLSRNFHGKETIFKLLDVMAMYKLNKLHLHLSDDDGFRIEIPELPELTQLGSFRCHDETETVCLMPSLGSGPSKDQLGSGYYTIQDYKEILKYAKRRHIEIIPEIDMPSHLRAAIKSLLLRQNNHPEEKDRYKMTDKVDGNNYRSAQGFNDNSANPCREGVYNFAKIVIETLIEAHKNIQPLTLFHFGGDEVPKRALNDMKCDMKKADIKQYFIQNLIEKSGIDDLSYGAWEDGLLHAEGDSINPYSIKSLSKSERDIYAFVWTEHHKALFKVANAGYKVINCRGAYLYFDHPYEPDPEERGLYWATRYVDTKMVFKFNPLKGEEGYGTLERPENIVGMQAQLWTELIRTTEQFDYMTYPRLQAFAERAWHKADWESTGNQGELERDWIEFANTIGHREFPKLDKLGVQYRIPPPGAIIKDGILHVKTVFPGLPVEYSVDKPIGQDRIWFPARGGEKISETIVLRSRSPDGKRYSREVRIRP